MIGAQIKYWGRIEDATKFWSELGINYLLVKQQDDMIFIKPNGKIDEENFKRLGKLQKEYGVKYEVHPYHLFVRNKLLDFLSDEESKIIFKKILEEIDRRIIEEELAPLITIHPPEYSNPNYKYRQTEEEALKAGKDFFRKLELQSSLALETMHDPYRNPGFALIGYRSKDFVDLIGDKSFGICLDTGHLNLAKEPLENFLKLPYKILSIHLHGNDGNSDKHEIPTKRNVKNWELIEKMLKKVSCPVILEIRNYNYSRDLLENLIKNLKKGVLL